MTTSRTIPAARQPGLVFVFWLCVVLTSGYGVAKLFLQRAHRPDFARTRANQYEGFVALDDYATRAALIRGWLVGEGGLDPVFEKAKSGFHPASLLIPAAVAVVSLVLPSIPLSFALLSLAALITTAWLAGRVARRLDTDDPPDGTGATGAPGASGRAATGWIAATLVVGHCLAMRTAAQLHMDPFCNLWAVCVVACCLMDRARRSLPVRLVLFAFLATGPLVKISLLPLLAVPALVRLWDDGWRRPQGAVRDGLLFGLAPLGLWIGVLWGMDGLHLLFDDMHDQATQFGFDLAYAKNFAVEMALLFQIFPLLLVLRGPEPGKELPVWLALGIILLATWGFRLPAIPRLYLPVMSMLAILAAPRWRARLGPRWGGRLLALYLVGNYAVAVLGLVSLL